jgi:NADPH:quinone reductase-like Zn-dependent oxidoreductase
VKALYFSNHGSLDQLIYGEVDKPQPGPTDVLIKVGACALNHLDIFVLEGWPGLKLHFPHIGGADIAGEVVEIGSKVTGIAAQDRVALTPGFVPTGISDEYIAAGEDSVSPQFRIFGEHVAGGFAEYVVAPAHTVVKIPDQRSFSQAAAPLLVGCTAWRMLVTKAQVRAGQTVLVVGSGGGVNSFSILLAKHLGAKVVALAGSSAKRDLAFRLGADEVIFYREVPDWERNVRNWTNRRGVDVVIDNVGQATFARSISCLARGGRLITVGNTSGYQVNFDNRLVFGRQISVLGSTMANRVETKDAIEFAWKHFPAYLIDRELGLSSGKDGYRALLNDEQLGKIVLIPGS